MRFFLLRCLTGLFAASLCGREVAVTVLATTDLHGYIYPYDYFTTKPAERGLAKIATLIKSERSAHPNVMLIDCGDTIQGSPIEAVYQQFVRTGKFPLNMNTPANPLRGDPMMLLMNHLRYDSMTVGNHEFNFGLNNLEKARLDANFPWISANTKPAANSSRKPFDSYIVKVVDGVKVAVVGVTTPAVPSWEKPENFDGYRFVDAVEAVREAVAEVRSKHNPDVVIVAAHAGLDRDLRTGVLRAGDIPGENMVYRIARTIPGIDAIVFGHTHNQVEEARIGEVLVTQPKNWGMSLASLDFVLESKPGGGYRVLRKSSRISPVNKVPADPEVLRMAEPYHEITERYLNTPVSNIARGLKAEASRVEDSALIDAVQQVQLYYAKADVSFASSFNLKANIRQGPVTVRQIAALYVYDNELYAIDGTGQMVKDALENSARYYRSCSEPACNTGPLLNRGVLGFNYDMAQGVSYEIDLTKPAGERIVNLRFKGQPLPPGRKLRIAVNNYRAAGSGGYTMFKNAKIFWRSYEDIRELIIRYYSGHALPTAPDNNWCIVPEAARQTLTAEAIQDSSRPRTQ